MLSKKLIQAKAFELFREWRKRVVAEKPELDFTIKDETVLVEDLYESIRSARKALIEEEKRQKRVIKGYDIGFMYGFISSNLGTGWEWEYIIKQSKEYKEVIAYKAIKAFFGINEIAQIEVSDLYRQLLLEDLNIDNLDTLVIAQKIENPKINDIIASNTQPYTNEILQALDNKITEFINHYLKRKTKYFLHDIENHFSHTEIEYIIEHDIKE
jgi:hypothetical protein